MISPHMPVHPIAGEVSSTGQIIQYPERGVSMRAHFVLALAAGMCANPGTNALLYMDIADNACKLADELLNRLNC